MSKKKAILNLVKYPINERIETAKRMCNGLAHIYSFRFRERKIKKMNVGISRRKLLKELRTEMFNCAIEIVRTETVHLGEICKDYANLYKDLWKEFTKDYR